MLKCNLIIAALCGMFVTLSPLAKAAEAKMELVLTRKGECVVSLNGTLLQWGSAREIERIFPTSGGTMTARVWDTEWQLARKAGRHKVEFDCSEESVQTDLRSKKIVDTDVVEFPGVEMESTPGLVLAEDDRAPPDKPDDDPEVAQVDATRSAALPAAPEGSPGQGTTQVSAAPAPQPVAAETKTTPPPNSFGIPFDAYHHCDQEGFTHLSAVDRGNIPQYLPRKEAGYWEVWVGYSTDIPSAEACPEADQKVFVTAGRMPVVKKALEEKGWPVDDQDKMSWVFPVTTFAGANVMWHEVPNPPPAPRAVSCWDINQNGVADLDSEDTNGDSAVNVLDCRGAAGQPAVAGNNNPLHLGVFGLVRFSSAPLAGAGLGLEIETPREDVRVLGWVGLAATPLESGDDGAPPVNANYPSAGSVSTGWAIGAGGDIVLRLTTKVDLLAGGSWYALRLSEGLHPMAIEVMGHIAARFWFVPDRFALQLDAEGGVWRGLALSGRDIYLPTGQSAPEADYYETPVGGVGIRALVVVF